jgi:hypothetical protein
VSGTFYTKGLNTVEKSSNDSTVEQGVLRNHKRIEGQTVVGKIYRK